MHQKGDLVFNELLARVRIGKCTSENIQILQSRVVSSNDNDYPIDALIALHVYRLNADVDKRNEDMLNSLAP